MRTKDLVKMRDAARTIIDFANDEIAKNEEKPMAEVRIWDGKGVLLEVGHGPYPGGFEKGAHAHGVNEYDLNWIAARACTERLGTLGIPCTITDSGASLYDIGAQAKEYDVFISIHHNAANASAQGAEALVHKVKHDPEDIELASVLSGYLAAAHGIRDRGVKKHKRLGVLSGAEDAEKHYAYTQASVLVECYFMDALIDNHHEWSRTSGYFLADGIKRYLESKA